MRGIILAGGAGTRLYPMTLVASKQLQPVFDKPMIYYPLATLLENGVREVCLISTPVDLPRFEQLLGDGSRWGATIEYRAQSEPRGIAEALLIGESFLAGGACALILGDNIFYGGRELAAAFAAFQSGATIFGYRVSDPERYGVVEIGGDGRAISIEEKPHTPRSSFAIPGLYLYDSECSDIARRLTRSARGELEISDVNRVYLERGRLSVFKLSRGFAWLDAGTSSSLHDTSAYVQTIERRQGIKIGCPEEIAFRRGYISADDFRSLVETMPRCEYRDYLAEIVRDFEEDARRT